MVDTQNDSVNSPKHYQSETGLEAIEVIEAFFPDNIHFANAFKYMARAGKKDNLVEDVEKAIWYLERYLDTQVRYVLTEKGKAVAEIRKAGIQVPLAKRIGYRGLHGYTWELKDDGEWHQIGGWQAPYSTKTIIEALKANENSRLVDLDLVDDADVVFRSAVPEVVKRLKNAGLAGDWEEYWFEDQDGNVFQLQEDGFWEAVPDGSHDPLSTDEIIKLWHESPHAVQPITPERPERTVWLKLNEPEPGDLLVDLEGYMYEYFDDGDRTGWGVGWKRRDRKMNAGLNTLCAGDLRHPTKEEEVWLRKY